MRVLVALVTVVLSQVVTPADKDVAKDVFDVKEEKCKEAGEDLTQEEKDNIYDTQLEPNAQVSDDGGHLFENFIRAYDPDGEIDVTPITEEIGLDNPVKGVTKMLTIAAGGPMAMILSLFWILCCWQCCCVGKCVKFEDTTGCQMPVKAGFSVCSGGLALGMLLCVALSPFGQLTDGVNRMVCTAAEMADVAMSGVDGATEADGSLSGNGFPGFLPVCEHIDNLLKEQLSVPTADTPDTAFVPAARAMLSDVVGLERKLSVIVSSLDLLSHGE
jgi:hypothetical protein